MNKKGFTLLEIIISAVIMAMVIAGLTTIFVAGKAHLQHSRWRMTSGELGRVFLEPLKMEVREDMWLVPNNGLQTGITFCDGTANPQHPLCPPPADRTFENIVYDVQYTITRDNPTPNVNKVVAILRWTEPAP